jgi:gas vesicle protein
VTKDTSGSGNLIGLVVGALLGAAVGAGVALLLAPRSGKETRERLARKTWEIKNGAARALGQAKEAVRRESKGIVGDAMETVANIRESIR